MVAHARCDRIAERAKRVPPPSGFALEVASYAERKGIDVREAERLLSANLAYDPD